MLSQGGEFAFVLLSLANTLRILPSNLNQLLIIVVVCSMALTPGLAETGKLVADKLDEWYPPTQDPKPDPMAVGQLGTTLEDIGTDPHSPSEPVVICGFTPSGQMGELSECCVGGDEGACLPACLWMMIPVCLRVCG
jgi:hypothetical protein